MSASVHSFTATVVSAYQEHDAIVVGIASDPSPEPKHALILQRISAEHESREPRSVSGPYSELVGVGPGGYDAVEECRLTSDALTMRFSENAAKRQRGIRQLHIELQVDEAALALLKAQLSRIFYGRNWYSDAA